MEIKGKVTQTMLTEIGMSKAGKQWQKQTIILETLDEKYPKQIACQLWGDKCDMLHVGQTVEADIEIESREYNGRWYTDVKIWKYTATAAPQPESPFRPEVSGDFAGAGENSGLPF
jgi:hypothetical protein